MPVGCRGDDTCDYEVQWEYSTQSDIVRFSISARSPQNYWTGIGIGRERKVVSFPGKHLEENHLKFDVRYFVVVNIIPNSVLG